jgi:ABC-type nitrate/sulfonate/bicarbonate transport system ATPase subunit
MQSATEAPVEEPRTSSGRTPHDPAAVEVVGLAHSFGELEVIAQLDLALSAGEVVGLVGPSGCGKSTLLELVGGLLEPAVGRILLDVAEALWAGAVRALQGGGY